MHHFEPTKAQPAPRCAGGYPCFHTRHTDWRAQLHQTGYVGDQFRCELRARVSPWIATSIFLFRHFRHE